MNHQDLFEKYMLNKEKEIQTPNSASLQILEPKEKMLGKSGISEKEFDKMFEEIIKIKL
jgi:hypothetical protein